MKKGIQSLIKMLISLALVTMFYQVSAQPPSPPTGSQGGGESSNQLGGNAPIDSGLFILMSLGAAYGGTKLYRVKKDQKDAGV